MICVIYKFAGKAYGFRTQVFVLIGLGRLLLLHDSLALRVILQSTRVCICIRPQTDFIVPMRSVYVPCMLNNPYYIVNFST